MLCQYCYDRQSKKGANLCYVCKRKFRVDNWEDIRPENLRKTFRSREHKENIQETKFGKEQG